MNILRNASAAYMLQGEDRAIEVDAENDMSLKDAAKGLGIHVGAAVNYWEIYYKTREQKYYDTVLREYDLITAETSCKMKAIAKTWTNFDYSKCDYLAKYAKDNGLAFRAHAALWAK